MLLVLLLLLLLLILKLLVLLSRVQRSEILVGERLLQTKLGSPSAHRDVQTIQISKEWLLRRKHAHLGSILGGVSGGHRGVIEHHSRLDGLLRRLLIEEGRGGIGCLLSVGKRLPALFGLGPSVVLRLEGGG